MKRIWTDATHIAIVCPHGPSMQGFCCACVYKWFVPVHAYWDNKCLILGKCPTCSPSFDMQLSGDFIKQSRRLLNSWCNIIPYVWHLRAVLNLCKTENVWDQCPVTQRTTETSIRPPSVVVQMPSEPFQKNLSVCPINHSHRFKTTRLTLQNIHHIFNTLYLILVKFIVIPESVI